MFKKRYLELFIDGYREEIKGISLDITNCTTNAHRAYEDGKKAARDDIQTRIAGPFNSDPIMMDEIKE